MAVSPAKKSATKAVAKKSSTAKKSPVKKPAAKKVATNKKRKISAEERYKMIEVAAYYIAEHNKFQGNAIDFWVAAEAEVSKKID